MLKAAFCCSVLLVAGLSTATAQLISIRTVPVSQAHQFQIFPSRTIAMGGLSIAIADSMLDPFVNPATGSRLQATRFFGSPSAYSVTSNTGGGRTLPIGALSRSDAWFGGVWLALQQVDLTPRPGLPIGIAVDCINCLSVVDPPETGPTERSQGNSYVFAMGGKQLADGLSLGGSFLWSRLNAIDGVDMLYNGSARIDQFGNSFDARVGVVKEWAGDRKLEALLLHNRFGTTHDVFYLDGVWNPGTQQFSQRTRVEHNLDRTNTWGLHLEYDAPLSAPGWRAGALLTVNRMDHPKIPNYAIMNIPRDPGHSSAFNVGLGLARTLANSTFGIDLVYEPIWSHTWADAEAPIESRLGKTIPKGGMTIENQFRFSNTMVRMGLGQEMALDAQGLVGGLQLGLAAHSIHYWLDQHDHIQVSDRSHEERWLEWTPTWGLSLRFPELEIRYHGSVTHGTGRPGIFVNPGRFAVADALGSNILAAPSGPLTLDEVKVTTHQISVSLPIR
ncbi:MAG: hypothetical protein ACRENP_23050 [Longimicrobiales bacterium]